MTDTARTNLDELIETERKRARDKIAKLRRQAEAEQRKVDLKIVELLKEKHPDAYEQFAGQARAVLEAERVERSRRVRRAVVDEAPAESHDHHGSEEHHG